MRTNVLANPMLLVFLAGGIALRVEAAGFPWPAASSAAATGVEAAPSPSSLPATADRARYGDPAQYEVRDLPVTVQDLQILVNTGKLLGDASDWNRNDDRECEDDEASGKRSLFCALQAASIQVLGSYDHRRVALQEVRFAIEEVTHGREFEHRLMEFNNLPGNTLAQVHQVLQIAEARVSARLKTAGTDARQ